MEGEESVSDEAKTRKNPKAAKTRAEHRPRIDAIMRAIREGKYDDELNQLLGAIQDRNTKRQEAVLGLVRETFGEDFVVAPARQTRPVAPAAVPVAEEPPPPEGWVDVTAEGAVPSGPQIAMTDDNGVTHLGDGIESRSPIIGPANPAD